MAIEPLYRKHGIDYGGDPWENLRKLEAMETDPHHRARLRRMFNEARIKAGLPPEYPEIEHAPPDNLPKAQPHQPQTIEVKPEGNWLDRAARSMVPGEKATYKVQK